MASDPIGKQSLDQLQNMLNVVLEQTARVFADASRGADKDRAVAAAARLRSVLPLANDNFHVALDDLEYELRMARWTLRRDLIRLRESKAVAAAASSKTNAATTDQNKDIDMTDAPPPPASIAAEEDLTDMPAESLSVAPGQPENKAASSLPLPYLQIDTTSRASTSHEGEHDREPQTAGMASVDFESLFQDPDSDKSAPIAQHAASKSAAATNHDDNDDRMKAAPKPLPELEMEVDKNSKAPESSLLSLLPGLESYANAAPDYIITVPDVGVPAAKEDAVETIEKQAAQLTPVSENEEQQQQQPQQQTSEQQQVPKEEQQGDAPPPPPQSARLDTTFDDLMNFGDFDMSTFGEGTFEDGAGGSTFDDNFFNLD